MLDRTEDSPGPDPVVGQGGAPIAQPAPPGEYAQLARLAARLGRAPIGLLRTGRLSHVWCDPALDLGAAGVDRLSEICRHLEGAPATAVIPDAVQDPRLWHNTAVAGPPHLRFVACVPVTGTKGEALGTVCIMDVRARPHLATDVADALADLGILLARLLERERDAAAQQATRHTSTRAEQIEAAVIRAQSCELALGSMLIALCRHHRATAGFVGKLGSTSRVMQQVHVFNEDPLQDPAPARGTAPLTPETSHAAAAIQAGTARTLVFGGRGEWGREDALLPSLDGIVRGPLRAEVIQPVHLLDERFGIVLLFDAPPPDLDGVAADLAATVRLVRPALYRKAAERRMHLLGTALDRANDAVLITEGGSAGESSPRIVYANAAFCRDSGYALEEVLGEPQSLLFGPDTDPAALRRLRQEMRRWRPVRVELLNYRKDGTSFWAELDLTPITNESGTHTHWVSIQRDVTERRAAEEERLRQEAKFRVAFLDNPMPCVVMDRDSLAFLEVNDAAVAQYGWSRAEFLCKSLPDLSASGGREMVDDPAAGSHTGTSTTHLRDDGTRLEVRAFIQDTVYGGQPAKIAVFWDVTELEAARRDMHHANDMLRERTLQLHARTEELAEAQRLARLGTWRMSADRRGVSWSREMHELAGLPRDASGMTFDALIARIHPEDRPQVQDAILAAARDGTSRDFEYRILLPEDQVRHMHAEVRPVLDAAGAVVELFGYSQDVSDAKRAEQALLRNESLRALGQLTGGVAHDFNNLLTVVILNLEESLEVLPPDHDLQDVLTPALHAAVRGAELTAQLLAYARRATLRPERVRPDEFFGALRPLLNRVLGERYDLQVLLRHNGGSAMVDPAQLDSAIMNLVINARDAMPGGGSIVLETRSITLRADSPGFNDEVVPGRYVVISVSDKGEGIPPHLLSRVFEPFFTTKQSGKGSGMGLSMVYGFARQSGGHVTLDSKPGEGTTVRLFLPVADGPAEDAALDEDGATEWTAGGLRALVVEDQDSVLRTVTRMLRQLGFSVVSASNAEAALEQLDHNAPFDVLFTDIVLPGAMDGVGLAEEVRDRCPGIKVLLTSGYTEHSLAEEDVTTPGMEFLMKPYKRQDLQAKFSAMFPRTHAGAF